MTYQTAFNDALNSLQDLDRQLIVLREVRGLSTEHVGAALGMSRAEAQVGLLRARRALGHGLVHHVRRTAR